MGVRALTETVALSARLTLGLAGSAQVKASQQSPGPQAEEATSASAGCLPQSAGVAVTRALLWPSCVEPTALVACGWP